MVVSLNVNVNKDINAGTFAQFFGVLLVIGSRIVTFSSVKNVPTDLAKSYCLALASFQKSYGLLPLCLRLKPGC